MAILLPEPRQDAARVELVQQQAAALQAPRSAHRLGVDWLALAPKAPGLKERYEWRFGRFAEPELGRASSGVVAFLLGAPATPTFGGPPYPRTPHPQPPPHHLHQ